MKLFNRYKKKIKHLKLVIHAHIERSHDKFSETAVRRCSPIVTLKHFSKFPGSHRHRSLLLNKVAGWRPEILSKNRLWHRCSGELKITYFLEHFQALLLTFRRKIL